MQEKLNELQIVVLRINNLQKRVHQLFCSKNQFMSLKLGSKSFNLMSFSKLIILLSITGLLSAQSFSNATTSNTTNTTGTNQTEVAPTWLNSSQTQLSAFMSDQYNYYLTKNGNKVWSGAMNIAWQEMKRNLLFGQNATFRDTSLLQQKIAFNYNSQLFTRKQLSDSCYYVSSGYGQQAQNRINLQIKQKYPNKTFPPLSYDIKEKDFLIYSYLQKSFRFEASFSQSTGFKFKNVTVKAFQSTNSKQRKQLYYKYYTNQNDFLMGIETDSPVDEILLLKTNRTEVKNFKMEKVLELVDLYSQLPRKKLSKVDKFKMPVLTFDFTRQFDEMKGLQFNNPGYEDCRISNMMERLKLTINKSGIQMYNDAVIIISRTSLYLDQKFFYLNKDFWVILKEKNKKPYLIMQVSSVNETWTG